MCLESFRGALKSRYLGNLNKAPEKYLEINSYFSKVTGSLTTTLLK